LTFFLEVLTFYISEQKANMPGSLSFFETLSPAKLVGIARLASLGESVKEGHEVEYFTLPVRSLLNRCVSKRRLPFTWTINPYRGCEFGCKYCYARYTHEFMEMRNGEDFERKIYIKRNAAWLLRQDLKRVRKGESIALGTATDPYQPAERQHEVTRAILEELTQHHGLSLGIVSKSAMIVRDIDLLRRFAENNELSVHITVTTMDANLARILEPRAPRPDLRMRAVRQLADAGLDVGINCAPVLPEITDSVGNLESVVIESKQAGARHIFTNPLFLKPCSEKVFMPFLEQNFPHLVEHYQQRFATNSFLSKPYQQRVSKLMAGLLAKHDFQRRTRERKPAQALPGEEQLKLF
jgi:DNA repair photolyase